MDRQWDQVTALASVIGVIGGLISVVYLILEIRHSADAIEGSTVQSLMALKAEVLALIAANAEPHVKGCTSEDTLSDAERLRFERIAGAQMSPCYSAFVQLRAGLIGNEVWGASCDAVRTTFRARASFASGTGCNTVIRPAYALPLPLRSPHGPGGHDLARMGLFSPAACGNL